ncbi:MAG: hypothetical protein H6726_11535 [Sandaracinaceae bacterium]|nr:hypothetical protein [Sandaracinaceae bacterium]
MKLLIATLFALAMGSAPFQCAADPDPERRMTDTPAEALFGLSELFEAEGNEAARRTTLETIIERYPSSREAARAQDILSGGDGAEEPSGAEPPADEAGPESAAATTPSRG